MPRWSIVSGTHVKYDRGIPGIKAGANDFIVVHEICDADGNKKSEDGGVNPKAKVVIAKGTAARDRVVRLIERGSFQPNNAGINVKNVEAALSIAGIQRATSEWRNLVKDIDHADASTNARVTKLVGTFGKMRGGVCFFEDDACVGVYKGYVNIKATRVATADSDDNDDDNDRSEILIV